MKSHLPILTLLLALALLSGCTQELEEQPSSQDQNFVVEEPPTVPLVEGRAENFVLSLEDFSAEGFELSQLEGEYSKDTTLLQQFKTFFKPVGYPFKPLDENTFVLTQTITIISGNTSREEIEQLYKTELQNEKEKHSIAIIKTNFAGEKSVMIQSTLGDNDLHKAFIARANTLNELALVTKGMPKAIAKEKLLHYSKLAEGKLAA